MDLISLLNHPAISSLAINPNVFLSVLLALLIYRIVLPVIDFVNPFIWIIRGIYAVKFRLLTKKPKEPEYFNHRNRVR